MASSGVYYNVGNGGQAAPIVVQGHPYSSNDRKNMNQTKKGTQTVSFSNASIISPFANNNKRAHAQQNGYRDVFWAVLFYAQLLAIVGLAVTYIPQMQQILQNEADEQQQQNEAYQGSHRKSVRVLNRMRRNLEESGAGDNADDEDYNDEVNALVSFFPYCGIAFVTSIIFITISMSFMMSCAECLIKTAMILNVLITVASAVGSLLSGMVELVIVSSVMAVVTLFYTCCVWNRIPFAAANLTTAVTAVRANIGLLFHAFMSVILVFAWFILWVPTVLAVTTVFGNESCDENGECSTTLNGLVLFFLLLSHHWTVGVITNVVHVTTAGTVGTFWFVPVEANGCCSKAVRDSYVRSITTSFGSICFGSLVVAIINAVRDFVHSSRENGDSFVACCADCILGCLEDLVEYFNKWAYVYVGLYGFSFMEAGANVMTLFRNRGWTSIIADVMVDTVLRLLAVAVALFSGLLFLLTMYLIDNDILVQDGSWVFGVLTIFAMLIGYMMAITVFSVVGSAVNTVIVCYAEAPNEFQTNHPLLSERMTDAWRRAYPHHLDH